MAKSPHVLLLFLTLTSLFPSTIYFDDQRRLKNAVSAQLVPIDTLYNKQKKIFANIQLEQAWDITTGSNEVVIAIIDDAIDIHHPDLRDNMMQGMDFVDGDRDPSPGACVDPVSQTEALEQHGTQVAGVIAAVGNNNLGSSGINWQVKIMPLRIGCYYRRDYEEQAMIYAMENGAHIINASYGGPDAIARNLAVVKLLEKFNQSVLLVTASGNYHINNDDSPVYPGSLGLSNVITVAASDGNNQLTEWTQYGASSVDLAAPGVGLQSTIAGENIFGDYVEVSGSSFSTAVVSGVAGLLLARAFDLKLALSAPQLKSIIQASVTPVVGHEARTKTSGVVNAKAALDLLGLPRPVLSIVNTNYDDFGAKFENSLLDEEESGIINIELENLWESVLSGSVSISVDNPIVRINQNYYNLSEMAAGERKILSVPIQTTQFSGHHRIRFAVDINVSGANKNVAYTRTFEWQVGVLDNKIQTTANIQQNKFDDYQYFHINVPPNMDRVTLELEYTMLDSRDMGLLADFEKRPQIHFRVFAGASYWVDARFRADNKSGFEYLGGIVPPRENSTLKIMVFNAPPKNLSSDFQRNKSYSLKSCFYAENDGNARPIVSAGKDQTVNAGDKVVLIGRVSDSDGVITRAAWSSSSKIEFIVLNDYQIQFTAPSTGAHRFVLEAVDNGCKRTVDSVTVFVADLTGNEPEGLLLNPRTLKIDENSGFNVLVSAFYENREVNNLKMISAPKGVKYINGNISWQNANPAGLHLIKFSSDVGNETLTGVIKVNVEKRSAESGGAGCVAKKNAGFDPQFLIYVYLSCFFIRKRINIRIGSRRRVSDLLHD